MERTLEDLVWKRAGSRCEYRQVFSSITESTSAKSRSTKAFFRQRNGEA
jgi:hypothetical protein